jgi:glycosyltransferase involved in cell wall biosynthesis
MLNAETLSHDPGRVSTKLSKSAAHGGGACGAIDVRSRIGGDMTTGRTHRGGLPCLGGSPIRLASIIKRLHVGGDETRLLTLARFFDPAVVDHVVIVVNPTDDERDERLGGMVGGYLDAGVEVLMLDKELLAPGRVSATRQFAEAFQVVRRLSREFSNRRIHVVDARLEFGTVFGLAAARLARVPVVVSTGYAPEYWRSAVRYPLGQLAFMSLDALISDAACTLAAYDEWRLSRHARLALIPNGIPPAIPHRPRDEVRAALGIPVDRPLVTQVARMIPRKGYETLIRAARLVVDRYPNASFLLCGFAESVEYRRQLERLARQLSLEDHMAITSYQGHIGDILGATDVFAHVSTFDSSPIAIHEAMSAGLPAVVSRTGGTSELIEDGDSGLLVPPGDPHATARAIGELLTDSELAGRLGAAARARYERRHRPEAMARAHERLYRELLCSRSTRRQRR